MLARRHELPSIKEPVYEIEDVERVLNKDTIWERSISQKISVRDDWISQLGEFVLLTNRAAADHERKCQEQNVPVIHPGKPLSLEYIADRLDTDVSFFLVC